MPPSKRVCLVSMPFVPVHMPGMGVSTLKAALTRDGIECDLYYGALEFLKFFSDVPSRTLRLDYDFIATNMHVGEIYFAEALWEREDSNTWMDVVIERLTTATNHLFGPEQMAEMAVRLRRYASSVRDLLDRCYEARDWADYDIIGFSSTFSQNVASLAMAKKIRAAHPDACIVFGGANCEATMGEQLLRSFPYIDYVIRGEADFAFSRFIRAWRSGLPVDGVPGIVYRSDDRISIGVPPDPIVDMDVLPVPDFDDYFVQLPNEQTTGSVRANVLLPIETSRGCWWGAKKHCIFCGLNPTMIRYRNKSPERAFDEFRELRNRHGETHFYAVDNILSRSYIKELLPLLEGQGLSIFYETKSNLREEEVAQLARAGIRQLQPGIEGLNSVILAFMKKGVTGHQNIETLKWCATYGVAVTWSYLYGFPNEPAQPYIDDARLLPLLHHLPPPGNANPILLDRFSPLFTEQAEFGVQNVRPNAASDIYYAGLSDEEKANLVYHFDMDLPQGDVTWYTHEFRTAILEWKERYLQGARFYQFTSGYNTLLIDTRHSALGTYLLDRNGARIYSLLRKAQPLRAVMELSGWDDPGTTSLGDAKAMTLCATASYLGSTFVSGPRDGADIPRFLEELVRHKLVVRIDNQYLALAVDCSSVAEAEALGLAEFAFRDGCTRPELQLATGS